MAAKRLFQVALGLLAASPAVAAESLIAGKPLVYDYQYHCGGQRIIVSRCGSTEDRGYCQVYYYPDDPNDNRMISMPVEKRGDVIAKLAACAAPSRPVAAAPANKQPSPVGASGKAAVAPGLGTASWHVLDYTDEFALFFTGPWTQDRKKMSRGWFTYVFSKQHDYPDDGVIGVQFTQSLYLADCSAKATKPLQIDRFDGNLKLLDEGPVTKAQFVHPKAGTMGAALLNIMCGRPQKLVDDDPVIGDGSELLGLYRTILELDNDNGTSP